MDDAEVELLRIHVGDQTVTVARDEDGDIWLDASGDTDDEQDLERFEPTSILLDGDVAHAGQIPDGAVEVVVFDRLGGRHDPQLGDGVWLLVVGLDDDFEVDAVLFRDANGEVVPTPQPADATAVPIAGADLPCPACGGAAWDLVSRPEREDWAAEKAFVCHRCGHEEGVFNEPGPEPPSFDDLEIPESVREAGRAAGGLLGSLFKAGLNWWTDRALDSVPFPVYGLVPEWDGGRSLHGFGTDGLMTVDSVDLQHTCAGDGVDIIVSTLKDASHERPGEARLAANTLEEAINPNSEDGRVIPRGEPADQLAALADERTRDRGLAAEVRSANERRISIPVDGQTTFFTVLEAETVWVAASRQGELDITITATGIAPEQVALTRVEDVQTAYNRKADA